MFQNFYKHLFPKKIMKKRGQLTIIIIIAAIIVALAVLAYFFWPKITSVFMNEQQASSFLSSQAEPLRQSVSDCVEQVSQEGFTDLGLNAGYYDSTSLQNLDYLDTYFVVVAYKDANKARINKLPSMAQISQQFSLYLEKEGNQKIDACLGNFAGFRRVMDIEPGTRTITPVIYDDSISIQVDWPMKISKSLVSKKVSQTINQKPAQLLIPLGNLHQVASDIVDCDIQIDCKFTGATWDQYTWNNPYLLRYINKQALNIDSSKRVFLLESVPYRQGEQPFKFNFGEDIE